MKRLCRLAIALAVLGFVVTAVLIAQLPSTVPVHYNFAGEVDRMGSKYEYVVFPCLGATADAIFLPLARRARAGKGKDNVLAAKILVVSAVGEVLLFNGLGVYFLWCLLPHPAEAAVPAVPADGVRLLSLVLGALLIILGSLMPKIKRNAVFGVRTKWSMSSDETWRKSQRFGGFASVTAGILLLAAAAFLKDAANLLAQALLLVLWAVLCVAASYHYYKVEQSA